MSAIGSGEEVGGCGLADGSGVPLALGGCRAGEVTVLLVLAAGTLPMTIGADEEGKMEVVDRFVFEKVSAAEGG